MEEARGLSIKIKSKIHLGRSEIGLGQYYLDKTENNKAENKFKKTLKLFKETSNDKGKILAYSKLGFFKLKKWKF